jgi:alpha-tubulin suppressor-like RCC1 family protein
VVFGGGEGRSHSATGGLAIALCLGFSSACLDHRMAAPSETSGEGEAATSLDGADGAGDDSVDDAGDDAGEDAGDDSAGTTSGGTGGTGETGDVGGPVLALGEHHSCALAQSGAVRCWGEGIYGRLGQANEANIGDDELPSTVEDIEVGGAVVAIAAGEMHTCAILQGGAVRCWGNYITGRLGYGDPEHIGDDELPASAGDVEVGGVAVRITAGDGHTCVVLDDASVRCWGNNLWGALGYGHDDIVGDDETPASAGPVDVGGPVADIGAGSDHTCALMKSGAVRCWGWARWGQLGYGNTEDIGDDEVPAVAGDVNLGGGAKQLAVGENHNCALLEDGSVRCWGWQLHGQLGVGDWQDVGDDESPALAGKVELGGKAVAVAAGGWHSCAILEGGTLRCWGSNTFGQAGVYGDSNSVGADEPPTAVPPVEVGGAVVGVATGENHTCAVMQDQAVRCWGRALFGQLGYGNTNDVGVAETPASVGDVDIW